jgi:hypothetical protein
VVYEGRDGNVYAHAITLLSHFGLIFQDLGVGANLTSTIYGLRRAYVQHESQHHNIYVDTTTSMLTSMPLCLQRYNIKVSSNVEHHNIDVDMTTSMMTSMPLCRQHDNIKVSIKGQHDNIKVSMTT